MGETGRRDVAAMFEGLTLGPTAVPPKNGSNSPAGINGTHGKTFVAEVQIGFFLHTPFPSSEVFRCVSPITLNERKELTRERGVSIVHYR